MAIVDRGGRDGRRPRSRWPEQREWPPRDRAPEPPVRPRAAAPTATYLIIAFCIAVFVYGVATGDLPALPPPNEPPKLFRHYAFFPAVLDMGDLREYLRLVTHMFLHGNWVHLFVNMIVLWSFGRGLEPVMGSLRFTLLYLVVGILAAIGQGLIAEQARFLLGGASGAIAGVVGAAAIAAPRLPVIFVIVPMPLWIAIIGIVILHVLAIALDWDPDIAWYAHLAGLALGAILYPLLRRH